MDTHHVFHPHRQARGPVPDGDGDPTSVAGPDPVPTADGGDWTPPVPRTLEDTGLPATFVPDLILKTLYAQGARTGTRLEETIRLPFHLLDDEILRLQQRRFIEVRGVEGHGRRGYTFDLTAEGRNRCRELLQTSRYVGPAPVPLTDYWESVEAQSVRHLHMGRERIRQAFRHLVFDDEFIDGLGPAINSGRSMFLYGHAGNGKTALAEAVATMMGEAFYLPYAIEVDGHIISVFDPVAHRRMDDPSDEDDGGVLRPEPGHDRRYVRVKRPVVMVGGELVLDDLELRYDEAAGVFRAPPQVKANGGVFVIDDFGRQRVRPRDLLNRWMVPLDRRMDFLGLPMGHKLPVPFDTLLIFATNLNPAELVEEAFLRRIQYKILVDDPSRAQYEEIFRNCCVDAGLDYDPAAVEHVYRQYYGARDISPRACHPRDIVRHLEDLSRYRDTEASTSTEMLDRACRTYFIEGPAGGDAGIARFDA